MNERREWFLKYAAELNAKSLQRSLDIERRFLTNVRNNIASYEVEAAASSAAINAIKRRAHKTGVELK